MGRLSLILRTFAVLAVLCTGCSDKDNTPDPDAGMNEGPLWVVTGWTSSGDEYNGFLATVGDLTTGELSLSSVVDLGTDMSFGSDEKGNVFVGRDDSPVIQRWSLDDAGVLRMSGQVSFASLGITSTMGGNRNVIQIISDTRAYYFDNEGYRVVIFNPTDMTITDNFSIASISADATSSSVNFITRVGDRFFVSSRRWDAEDETLPGLRVAIVSATTNAVEYANDDRCSDMAFTVSDEAGNVYFGSHHALAVYGASDTDPDAHKPCIIRILKDASEFDVAYHVDLNALVDGYGAGLFQGPNGTAFIAKYEGTDPDPTTAFNAAVWRLYTIELGNEESSLTQVAGLPLVTRYVAAFDTEIDGELVPFLVTDSETGSTYMNISNPSAPTPGLTVNGAFFGRAARLTR